MAEVMIGIDPRKGSHTAVAIGAGEEPLGEVRAGACPSQAGELLAWAAGWPERAWAVEGAAGLGHLLAQQLVAAGEQVLDVPPKLAARVRLLQAGDTNKNDPNDARSVAVAAPRSTARRPVLAEDHAAVLKVWAKRHRDLARARNQAACRLHAVLCDLVPGGHQKEISAAQAARILERVTPSGAVARARCELAAEFLTDIRRLDAQLRDTSKKLAAAVRASGTGLTGLFGVGPVIAGTVIGDVRQVFRFPRRDHFAACNGTAPVEVSSGGRKIYRLSLRGNRRLNHAIHMAAITQIGISTARAGPATRRNWRRARRTRRRCGHSSGGSATRSTQRWWPTPGRPPPACRKAREGNRGTALSPGRPATPRTPALRASHSRACHHHTTRRYRRSRPKSAEPSPSAPGPAPRGRVEKTPANQLTPTAKRARYARSTRPEPVPRRRSRTGVSARTVVCQLTCSG